MKLWVPMVWLAAAMLMTAADAAPEKTPLKCGCNCRKCPPAATLTKNEQGVTKYRGCFRDKDRNGLCDNSVKSGRKCRNNCVAVPADSTDATKDKVPHPCANCPCPANCAQCVLNAKK